MNSKTEGTRKSLQTMLFYHLYAIDQEGIENPKEYIAKELSEMIGLSEEHYAYVKDTLKDRPNVGERLKCANDLLKSIKRKKKLDIDSLDIVINLIDGVVDDINEAIKEHIISMESDEDAETTKDGISTRQDETP